MTDLIHIPMEDDFETSLSSSWNGATGTVSVNSTPAGTIPTGKKSYIVVSPGESNMQVAEVDGWVADTSFNVTSIAVPKGQGGNYSAVNHAAGAVVRFSNNYAFWKQIMDSIASKADNTDLGNFVFSGDTQTIAASNFRIRKDGDSMKFRDDETAEVSLKTLTQASIADQYVAVSSTDTTVGHLDDKLTAGDGLKKTIIDPAGDEKIDLDIDTADTATFVKTSSGAADENKVPVLGATGKLAAGFIDLASDAEATAGVLTTKPITPKQYKDNLYQANFIFVASDTLQSSADTERSRTNTVGYTEVKKTTINNSGTVRIKFDVKKGAASSSYFARIYKNGVAVGTDRTGTQTEYTTYSQDFTCNKLDFFSLYIRTQSGGNETTLIQNFRIYFTNTAIGDTIVNTD